MSFENDLNIVTKDLKAYTSGASKALDRLRGELEFASRFAHLFPDQKAEWQGLILKAGEYVRGKLSSTSPDDLSGLVAKAEDILAPVGKVAKGYTVHCCGHAHIDMNWTWPLVETIATAHDTFSTLDRLMNLFPDLKYAQSQITIYQMMQEHCPEIWEMIKKRIAEGLWQVTAGSWVEGDKNMASGESLCRHILYSKRWVKENLGIEYDSQKIDWMPDTFGHPWTMPSILSAGGITRYYRCRPDGSPWLNWWQGPDGSRVLAFRDKGWYNAEINAEVITSNFIDYVAENGLKDFLWVYGVGDHGGGVTKGHLINARELDSWPVFPNMRLSSIDSYFDSIEPVAGNIAVNDGDYNTTFEGCYTSQSRIKKVNRLAETIIPEAETISLVADAAVGFDYRSDQIQEAWSHMMFNQFHDILAGSSGHAAMEEAEIRFQKTEALTGSIKMRALRKLASQVDTAKALGETPPPVDIESYASNFGRGAGDLRTPGRMTTWSSGNADIEPLMVFNSLPYPRSEMVMMKVWGRDWPTDKLAVVDDQGKKTVGQVIGTSSDVGHAAINVLFPANDIPAVGYRVFGVSTASEAVECTGVTIPSPYVIENEYLHLEVDGQSGAIKHLINMETGWDCVPTGELLGLLELYQEAPHGMTAWEIGQIISKKELREGGVQIDESDFRDSRDGDSLGMVFSVRQMQKGPQRAAIRTLHMVNKSRVRLEVALSSGSKMVEINVSIDWKEIGSPDTSIPMLKMAVPLDIAQPKFLTEIPFGSMERPIDGKEFPALRWVNLSNSEHGATLVNDCKYSFSADRNKLRATLIRSTYDPDAYPELGRHDIRFGLIPHSGPCDTASATRTAELFNQPMCVIGTDIHTGSLPVSSSYAEVLTPNISIAAMKKAEDSDAVIIRLYETAGIKTEARIRLNGIVKSGTKCVDVDLMEQPTGTSAAFWDDDILVVPVVNHGISTVIIG